MSAEQLDKKVRSLMNTICDIQAASSILNWDQETYMPSGAAETRAEQISSLDALAHQFLTGNEAQKAVEAITTLNGESAQYPLLKLFKEDFEKAVKIPEELVRKTSKATALAHESWKKARQAADFSLFEKSLQELVDLKIEAAELYGYEKDRYDALLNIFEPGMTVGLLTPVFDRLKTATKDLLDTIEPKKDTVTDAPMLRYYPHDGQMTLSALIAERMGFKFENGRIDLAAHPFCTSFSQYDVRLTTRVNEHDLGSCLYGVIHEAGHGMYEQGFSTDLARTFGADGASMGIHESQSLLWETIITRSEEFWQFALPHLQKQFPGTADDLTPRDLFKAVNKVQPSLIRVDADEVTYNMHIVLRFEIEQMMINGKVALKDIPELWNEKMRNYLGVVPPDNAKGCLQDIHWSFGGFGYFPSYTLGKLYAAMLWKVIQKDIPNIRENIATGDFTALLGWLRENIHTYGRTQKPGEIMTRITGSALNAEAFVEYINTKFADVYR